MADELIALFGQISTNDHEELVDQFSKVLQVDPHVATFFLEASCWNVETAVHNYLASQGGAGNFGAGKMIPLTSPPQATFNSDLAPWQSRPFQCGTRLPIRVQFQNTGSSPWPTDTCLLFVDGERMGYNRDIPVRAGPGQMVELVMVLTVPREEGAHMGTWRLACSAGYFGEPIYMIVHSLDSAPPVSFDPQEFRPRGDVLHIQQQEVEVDQLLSMATNSWNVGSESGQQQQQFQHQQNQQQMMFQQQQQQQQQQFPQQPPQFQQGGGFQQNFAPSSFQFFSGNNNGKDDSMGDS